MEHTTETATNSIATEKPPIEETPARNARGIQGKIIFLLFIALLNVIGIGILFPVLPFIVQQYTGTAELANAVGWLASIYAICQFISAPLLGLLSDRYGRRPVLLICLLGSALGYLLFGYGGALWVLFAGRIIDGLTGGNFSVLSAYLADITRPEERGKYFGWFGAVAGIGFIAGPIIGGFAAKLGYQAPVYIAAALTIASLIWGFFYLPESLKQKQAITDSKLADINPFHQMKIAFSVPQLRWLLITTFLYALPFTVISTNTTILTKDSLGWNADSIGLIFLVIGVIDIIMQGFVSGKLLPIFGEAWLTLAGLVCEALCCALMGMLVFIPSPIILLAGVVIFSIGSGLLEPSLRGLLSRAASDEQQGFVQGGAQSVQSIATVVGPLCVGALYTQVGHAWPYWSGTIVAIIAVIVVAIAMPHLTSKKLEPKSEQVQG